MALHYFYPKLALFVLLSLINDDFVQSSPVKTQALRVGTKSARNDPCLDIEGGFCQNNGFCYLDDKDKFACRCRYGYIGVYCEFQSLCLLPYCLGDGVCKDKENAAPDDLPTCKCKPGRTGTRCEILVVTTTTVPPATTTTPIPADSLCKKFPDKYCNTGTCTEVNGRVKCECPPAYSGNRCEISSGATPIPGSTTRTSPSGGSSVAPGQDVTCAQSPCNGRGTCYDTGNTYYCLCYPGYTGNNCSG